MAHDDGTAELGPKRPIPDGLALEYKRDYGTALRDLDVADLVNNPAANGECRVFGLGFEEQPVRLFTRESGVLLDDLADPALVGFNRVKPFF